MSIFDDIKSRHGDGPTYPNKNDFITIFGYRAGECLGTFSDGDAARAAGAATIEKNIDEKAFKAAVTKYRAHGQAIFEDWLVELRDGCAPVNDATWNAVYAMAYDRGHSSGYGEVELYIRDYIDFARKIIEANK